MVELIEAQCINYMLENRSMSLMVYNNLDHTYFNTYLQEYNFIKKHYDTYGNVPDKETLLAKFPEFEFIAVKEEEKYLVKELREAKLFRDLVPDVNKVVDLMSNNKTDEAVKYLIQASKKAMTQSTIEPIDLIEQAQIRFDEYEKKTSSLSKFFVSTGLKELDEIIGGWDRQEELAVVTARTNQGKSWWLIYFALHAAMNGLKVGIYSGEMSPNKVGYRLDTFLFNISNWGLTHGDINVEVQYKESISKIKELVKNSILVVTPEMLGGNATVTKLRAFIERSQLDMLFIDQVSLMDDERKHSKLFEKASSIAQGLKELQTLTQVPIIAVAQLGRGDAEKEITVENIAGSYDIARYATTVIMLEQKDKGAKQAKRVVLSIGKARDAQVGAKLTYMWSIDTGKLTFVPTENDATKGSHTDELKDTFGDMGDIF